ncbi:DUF433 domain-containing protein [Synechococcus sp. PCC 7336]|uniref:DUF433 domain-containing protein n=1 Tax=Synechococcus sp. PCC 7336 TaxID=195250 RepID=UPI0003657EC7|nr:DUF433 domain-containing protein [Synechococcus sp. PCC 7336]
MSLTLFDMGRLIAASPNIQGGRPMIAGTGTSFGRIVALYKQGYSPDEIVTDKDYLTLAQVYAALAYYYANRPVIEQDLVEESAEYDRLASQAP